MSKFFNVCFWILAIFLFLIALASFSSSDMISMGVFFIFVGLLALPPLRTRINKKLTQAFTNTEKAPNHIVVKIMIGVIKFILIFIVFMTVVSTSSNVSQNAVETANSNQIQAEEKSKETKNKYRNNKNTKLIAEETGLDKDSAGKVYETLVNCGVGNIDSIKLFAQNKDYADTYDIKASGIPVKLVVYIDESGNIPELYYDLKDIIVEGKRVASITDYVLTYDEWLNLRTQAQIYLEKFLVAPKTAKYYNQAYSIDENKVITVSGTVEAQNLYGVPLNNTYSLQYKKTDSGFSLQKGTLGNEKIY